MRQQLWEPEPLEMVHVTFLWERAELFLFLPINLEWTRIMHCIRSTMRMEVII